MPALRTLSAAHREWLLGELPAWRDAGLVDKAAGEKILGLYESAATEKDRAHGWFLISLGGLAALLLFAAAALLVSYNWQGIPASGKLVIVFGALFGIYAAAAALWRANYQPIAEIVIFFGGLFFGAAIWLIAQIFQMDAHFPDGYLWWALGVLPLALIFDTRMLHTLLAGLVAAWVGTEILGFGQLGALLFGNRWPIANGCYLAPLLLAPGMWLAYRRNSSSRVAIYLPALVWWVCLQPIAWQWHSGTANFIGAVGALLLIIGESHLPNSKLAIAYRALGAMLFGGALIPLSYHNYHQWIPEETPATAIWVTLVIASLTVLTLAVAEYLRYRALEKGDVARGELFEDIRRRQWLPLSLAAMTAVFALGSLARSINLFAGDASLIIALLANVAMLAFAVWLMRVGVRDNRSQPFVGGVAYFLIWMILRYSDLFGIEAGMLGAAALFAACGVAIGGLAWFWQQRKQVLHVRT